MGIFRPVAFDQSNNTFFQLETDIHSRGSSSSHGSRLITSDVDFAENN